MKIGCLSKRPGVDEPNYRGFIATYGGKNILKSWLHHVAPTKIRKKMRLSRRMWCYTTAWPCCPAGWPGVILGIALPVDVDDHLWGLYDLSGNLLNIFKHQVGSMFDILRVMAFIYPVPHMFGMRTMGGEMVKPLDMVTCWPGKPTKRLT